MCKNLSLMPTHFDLTVLVGSKEVNNLGTDIQIYCSQLVLWYRCQGNSSKKGEPLTNGLGQMDICMAES
jgi:hypothetical protein